MVRSVLGVVVGAVVWMVGFFVLALVLAQLWPDYAIHGRQWTRQGVWYNLGVVIPAVPAVVLGGKLANSLRAARSQAQGSQG
jgi:hypothetical protein